MSEWRDWLEQMLHPFSGGQVTLQDARTSVALSTVMSSTDLTIVPPGDTTLGPLAIVLIVLSVILGLMFLVLLIFFIVLYCNTKPPQPDVEAQGKKKKRKHRSFHDSSRYDVSRTDVSRDDEESTVSVSRPRRSRLHGSRSPRHGRRSSSRNRSSRRSSRNHEDRRGSSRRRSRSRSPSRNDDRTSRRSSRSSRHRDESPRHRSSRRSDRESRSRDHSPRHRSASRSKSRSPRHRSSNRHRPSGLSPYLNGPRADLSGTNCAPSFSSTKSFEVPDRDVSVSGSTKHEQSTSETVPVVNSHFQAPMPQQALNVAMNSNIHQPAPPSVQPMPQQPQKEKEDSGSISRSASPEPIVGGPGHPLSAVSQPPQASSGTATYQDAGQRFIQYQQKSNKASLVTPAASVPPPVGTLPASDKAGRHKAKSPPVQKQPKPPAPVPGPIGGGGAKTQSEPSEDSAHLDWNNSNSDSK